MRRVNPEPEPRGIFGFDPRAAAKLRLAELVKAERRRAQLHMSVVRRSEPTISKDRLANLMIDRWKKLASIEGGMTGAIGFVGVPINLLLLTYCQIALIVSIAEVYDVSLEGDAGEDALLGVLGRAHGVEDLLRSTPRVLAAVAKALALKHGFSTLGRLVPLVASPIAAKLNERDMERLGQEALRRFGNIVRIE